MDETKEDEVVARDVRTALKAQLLRMDTEYNASIKGKTVNGIKYVASLPGAAANRIAANPYLNNRVVKGIAIVGLEQRPSMALLIYPSSAL